MELILITDNRFAEINKAGAAVQFPLQLLNSSKPLQPEVEVFIKGILYGKEWTKDYFLSFSDDERSLCKRVFEIALNSLAHEDKERFLVQVGELMDYYTKRQIWENNHVAIINAISALNEKKGRFPSRTELSIETGISRPTINKHLKEYFGSEQYNARKEDYLLMREKVLARIFNYAVNGDTRAAKVFLEATDQFEKPITSIRNQQNNFIQINGTTVTEEQIKELPEDQQIRLMELLGAIKQPHIDPQSKH